MPLSAEYLADARAFGEQVRALRKRRGWSQDQLIAESGHEINKKTLQRVERGTMDGDPNTPANTELRSLLALCRVLGVKVVLDVNRPSGFVIEIVEV
jgi:transcriptional regulator with XRE-family HTH domain